MPSSPEFGLSPLESEEFSTEITKISPEKDPDGIMRKLAKFARTLPGGKVVLTAIGMAQMLSGGVSAEAAPASPERTQTVMRLREGMETMMPIKFALKAGWGEYEKRPDNSVVLKSIPSLTTTFGDAYYQTNGFRKQFAGRNITEEINQDISKINREIAKHCGSRENLAKRILGQLGKMVKEIWPRGTAEKAQLPVTRYAEKDGKIQPITKTLPFSWVTVQEGMELAMRHNEPLLNDLSQLPSKERAVIISTLLDAQMELEMDAAAQIMEGESR